MKHLVLVALTACSPDVPETPSFQEHVAPILAANCLRCHGYPAIGGAPEGFRLDSYEDLPLSDEPSDTIAGAASLAPLIAARVASSDAPMPPRFGLDDYQIETLTNWDGTRGPPRANNEPPVVTATLAGLSVVVRVDDADDSIVSGQLRLIGPNGDSLVGLVRTGTTSFVLDASSIVKAGTYRLLARVDDGAEVHAIEALSFEVPP